MLIKYLEFGACSAFAFSFCNHLNKSSLNKEQRIGEFLNRICFLPFFAKENRIMAIAIKSIPTLKNDAAKAFVQNAEAASSMRATVNFSKQVASTRTILKKAKMK